MKWLGIFWLGEIIFAYSAVLPIFLDTLEQFPLRTTIYALFAGFYVIILIPVAFVVTILNFYMSNPNLIIWLIWEIVWIICVYFSHIYQDRRIMKNQATLSFLLGIIAVVPFLFLNLFSAPFNPGIPGLEEIQVLDPFYTIQICWMIPLWFIVWLYLWVLRIPQELRTQRTLSINQLIWICLFLILNVYVIFFLGEYIWWIPKVFF